MKARLFTVFVLVVSIALLASFMLGGAQPTIAQSQSAAPIVLALSPAPSSVAGPILSSVEGPAPAPDRAQVAQALRSAPVIFIENVGQFPDGAHFQVRGGSGTIWLAEDAIWITLAELSHVDKPERISVECENALHRGVNLKLSFPGASSEPRVVGFDRLDTVVSYFMSNDPAQWHGAVPVWGGVRYADLYPGVDLELTSAGGQWRQRIIARPGADLKAVRLRVEGAEMLALDGDYLRLTTAIGNYTMPLLQLVTADNSPVPTLGEGPKVRGNDVVCPFASLTASSRSLSAVSPMDNPADLLYSTFLGGSMYDEGHAITVDGSGAAYVVGGD